jgi:two-component system cell cycle response regulator
MPRPTTALIVDDELPTRVYVRLLLRELGFTTLWEAADGAEALASVQRERPGLVLMDVTMPGTSGWNAVRALREDPATRDIPIIVVTGLSGPSDRDASIAAGCDAFLAKPVPPLLLLAEVRKFLPV